MRIQKRLAALAMTLLLCCAFSAAAYAHDVPDMTQTGAISAVMLYEDEAVGGGTLTLYKVGDVAVDDGDYSFTLTDDFAGSGVSLEDVTDTELSAVLATYASENNITGTTISIASDGTWTVDGLSLGLYLVVQYTPADGFEAITPFLVSVPMYDEGAGVYVYEVSAEPKLGTLTEAETEAETDSAETETPSASAGSVLPQTGQLNWPVPVLAALGLILLVIGWGMRFGRQRGSHEG